MNVITGIDRSEALLWTILDRFESLAVRQYADSARALLTPEKAAVVTLLRTRVHSVFWKKKSLFLITGPPTE